MSADILIVDDEADIRDLVAGILQDEGHRTRLARDSDEALRAIAGADLTRTEGHRRDQGRNDSRPRARTADLASNSEASLNRIKGAAATQGQ